MTATVHSDPFEGGPPQHLLIRGVNWLGDAIMSTPALIRIRERFPATRITVVTPSKIAALYEKHPAVDHIISIDRGDGLLRTASKIKAARADAALILPNSPRTALECLLGGIPKRIGHSRGWRGMLLTWRVEARPEERTMRKRSIGEIQKLLDKGVQNRQPVPARSHHIHQYLHLAAAIGASPEPVAPMILLDPSEKRAMAEKWRLLDPQGQPGKGIRWIGINAGAEYGPAKRWPVERFAGAAVRLAAEPDVGLLILGGPGDTETAGKIEASLKEASGIEGRIVYRNTAGQTSLRELAALISNCAVLLTNDTGPMHLGAAVGTPLAALFGSTSPELTAPGLPGDPAHRILSVNAPCSPCFLKLCPIDFRCLNGLSVDRVVEEVRASLRRSR